MISGLLKDKQKSELVISGSGLFESKYTTLRESYRVIEIETQNVRDIGLGLGTPATLARPL